MTGGASATGQATATPNAKAALRALAQRVVDLGPDGPVAGVTARLRALRAARSLRRDDGRGVVPEAWFSELYARDDDPWGYVGSDYEARRYALTLAALPRPRYRSAYEPGCSIGLLSEGLAGRCDALLSSDYAPAAVEAARERLAPLGNVRVEQHELPTDYPDDERFDLVLLADVGMFLSKARLDELTRRMVTSLEPGGHLVAVHGHGLSADIFQPGDQVHARIRRHPALRKVAGYRDEAFRLDVWERRP